MPSLSRLGRHRSPLLCALLAGAGALAQTTTLHTFTGDSNTANLVQTSDGTIYGVTRPSSVNATTNGTVFKLQPDGTGYQVVHAFAGGASGARLPDYAFMLARDGALYGTGQFGGTANGGMLYKVNPDGSGFVLLRSFTGHDQPTVQLDAGTPQGGLVHASDGVLYGAATKGTATSTNADDRNGVIYRIAPDGTGYRLIFSFDGAPSRANGIGPNSLIEGRDGRLYGTTIGGGAGGVANGRGTVFALRTDGTGFTVLRSFNNSVPALEPSSPLVQAADGYLYGTTRGGSIYRLLPDGAGFETIATFPSNTPARGLEPSGAFFQGHDGSLYGRTNSGGANNRGVIFKVRTDGSGFRVLHSFTTDRSPYFNGLIQGADGALYATTATSIVRVVEPPAFEITQQPRSQTVAPGGSVTFTVTAPGATTYQWRRNGTNIAGATASAYTLNNVTAAANATYSVVVGNGNTADSVTSNGAVLLVAAPNPGRLINLSVRTGAGSGAETLIAGFVVGGTGSKQVLVRAIGPTLGVFGVTGALADPRLGLFSGSTETATNSGWGGTTALTNAFAGVGAFALGATSRDAALLSTLAAGAYSAQVT
ncbi:MAG: hypothetical protein JNL39_01140, partial [Opitutaceae bacterium]|nr:hypothetical protein [Opitutaceae bacterium]